MQDGNLTPVHSDDVLSAEIRQSATDRFARYTNALGDLFVRHVQGQMNTRKDILAMLRSPGQQKPCELSLRCRRQRNQPRLLPGLVKLHAEMPGHAQ